MTKAADYRARRGRGCKADLLKISRRGEPRTNQEKPRGRRHPAGCGKGEMTVGNIEENIAEGKYIGDDLLQKTYTVDFLFKKWVKNNGIML